MTQAMRQTWLFGIIFVILFGAVWFSAAQIPAAWELSDFHVTFYRAARYFLRGENVYLSAYPHPFNGREYPPYAPIWALYAFVPFAALSLPYAEGLRVALDVVAMPFLAYLCARLVGLRRLQSIMLIVIAPWVFTEIHSGQLTPLVFLGALLCYWGIRRVNAPITAIGLWFALSKFTIVSLVIFATVVFAWRRKILGRTLAILAALILVASLASPTWFIDLLQLYLDRLVHPRLVDSVLLLPDYPWAQLGLLTVGALFVIWCVWRWRMDQPTPWFWSVLIAASLVGALHTFIYDWQMLMLPLALLIRSRWGVWFTVVVYVYSLLWVILSAGMDIPIPSVKMIPGIILAVTVGWGFVQSTHLRPSVIVNGAEHV